jgi:PRTRC genetic system protein E
MKTTNFFTEMSKFAEHADLKMTISLKGESMTVSVLPEMKAGGKKLTPFVATGTIHELDEGLIPELDKAITDAGGFQTNTAQFTEAVKEHQKEEAEDVKPAAKKSVPEKKTADNRRNRNAKKVASSAKKSAPKAKAKPAKKPVVKKEKSKPSPVNKPVSDAAAETPPAAPPVPEKTQAALF